MSSTGGPYSIRVIDFGSDPCLSVSNQQHTSFPGPQPLRRDAPTVAKTEAKFFIPLGT